MPQITKKIPLFALAALLCAPALASKGEHDEPGWVAQVVGRYGRYTLFVNTRGIRMNSPQLHYNVIAAAPKWDVVHFNTKSKTVYSQPLQEFMLQHPTSKIQTRPDSFKKGTPTVLIGLPAQCFNLAAAKGMTPEEIPGFPKTDGTERCSIVGARYYCSTQVKLPPQALAILAGYTGVPNFGGIPLEIDELLSNGKVTRDWYTISVKREIVSSAQFELPKGYQKKTSQALVFGGGVEDQLDELVKDMGIGQKLGK